MWRAVNAVLASVVALVLLSKFRTVPLVVSPRLVLVRPVPAGPAPAGTPPPGGLRIAPVATRQPGSGLAESPGRKVANRAGRYAGTDGGVVGSAALSRGADAGTA